MRRVLIAFLLILSTDAVAQKQPVTRATEIEPNESVEATLSLGDAPYAAEFTFEVSEDVYRLELLIEESPADLDLFAFPVRLSGRTQGSSPTWSRWQPFQRAG